MIVILYIYKVTALALLLFTFLMLTASLEDGL